MVLLFLLNAHQADWKPSTVCVCVCEFTGACEWTGQSAWTRRDVVEEKKGYILHVGTGGNQTVGDGEGSRVFPQMFLCT